MLTMTTVNGVSLEAVADASVAAVRPVSSDSWQALNLEHVLNLGDTFYDTKGETDPRLRSGVAGLSRRLRRVFPHDASPICRLVTRRIMMSEDNMYLGIQYVPTALGDRVREKLAAEGLIRDRVAAAQASATA